MYFQTQTFQRWCVQALSINIFIIASSWYPQKKSLSIAINLKLLTCPLCMNHSEPLEDGRWLGIRVRKLVQQDKEAEFFLSSTQSTSEAGGPAARRRAKPIQIFSPTRVVFSNGAAVQGQYNQRLTGEKKILVCQDQSRDGCQEYLSCPGGTLQ